MPVDSARISAIPMMPMEPAKDVSTVLPFLVERLFMLSPRAVKNDIDVFFLFPSRFELCARASAAAISSASGS